MHLTRILLIIGLALIAMAVVSNAQISTAYTAPARVLSNPLDPSDRSLMQAPQSANAGDYVVKCIPNPATDMVGIYVRSTKAINRSIEVFDETGSSKHFCRNVMTNSHLVDVSRFPRGVYQVHVVFGNGQQMTVPLVVNR